MKIKKLFERLSYEILQGSLEEEFEAMLKEEENEGR